MPIQINSKSVFFLCCLQFLAVPTARICRRPELDVSRPLESLPSEGTAQAWAHPVLFRFPFTGRRDRIGLGPYTVGGALGGLHRGQWRFPAKRCLGVCGRGPGFWSFWPHMSFFARFDAKGIGPMMFDFEIIEDRLLFWASFFLQEIFSRQADPHFVPSDSLCVASSAREGHAVRALPKQGLRIELSE